MIKNFDYNRYTDKDLKVYNKVSLFEALQQASRVETSTSGRGNRNIYNAGGASTSKSTYNDSPTPPVNNNVSINPALFKYNPNGFNIRAACEYILKRAYPKYDKNKCGSCAKAVRSAIDVGFNTDPDIGSPKNPKCSFTGKNGRPVSAYQYATFLPKIGFKHIVTLSGNDNQRQWSETQALPGDIAVMAHGKHGHICMWTGEQWVSDYMQYKKMWAYSGNGTCEIFRFAESQ